ncbi:MAG: energy transducer TonB [Sphingomonas sp.]|uniref:energy transducer TonB n=1 Tax=Sphingomonas sp. TaxID=28214 RepID=UPI0025D53EFC|nr:energy transducer TonB [Sphingomonas sp.]MBX3563322.1 energy transducer TonB [Sphingomonas sp.]
MREALAAAAIVAAVFGAQQAAAQSAYGKPLPDGRAPTVFTFYAGYQLPDDAALLRNAELRADAPDWLSPADYPKSALDAGITGSVIVQVDVGPDDALLRCRVIEDSQPAILGDVTCSLLRARGVFRHALTVEGMPTAGQVRIGAKFDLEIPKPPSNEPVNVLSLPTAWATQAVLSEPKKLVIRGAAATFTTKNPGAMAQISARGDVTGCRISWTTGTDEGDIQLCRYVSAARFKPALDKAGRPMASELYVAPQIIR